MKRRTMLKRASALTGSMAVAGCLSEGAGGGGGETTTENDGGDGGDGGDGDDSTGTEETTAETTQQAMVVGSKSVETTNTGCGSENAASVSFTGSGASIEGSIPTSNPCHEAAFAGVKLADGELTVTMEAVEKDVDACEQCLGQVEYTARIQTDHGVPSKVTVEHDAMGETTTVAEQSK